MIVAVLVPTIVHAQVCKIKGTYDTIEVARDSYNPQNNTLSLVVNSDSQHAANLTVTVKVTYIKNRSKSKEETYSEKFIANPSVSTKCDLTIPNTIDQNYELKEYKISLSGYKCE